MTKKELSQLYWLNREIEEEKRKLRELEAAEARAALDELGQTDTDTAARMRAAINERMEGWTV